LRVAVCAAGIVVLVQAGTAQGFHAYAWSPVPEDCAHLTHTIWFRADSDPAEVAADSLTRPEGRRAVFSWDMHRDLLRHPEDVCIAADGQPTTFQGVWPEKGIEATRARFADFFRRFADAGGDADWLILDFEDSFSNWSLGGMDKKDHWLAIQQDSRFADLSKVLGFEDLTLVADFAGKRNYLKWNAAMGGVVDDALNRAVFGPARAVFPDLRCSNYESYGMREEDAVPDLNGHRQWREGEIVGTCQAPSFYTWINQLSNVQLDGEKPFGQSPFAGVLLSVDGARAMRRASPLPLQPWIAWRRYKGDGPGLPPVTVAETPYYDELVRHLALTGATEFLFWNPHPWTASQKPEDFSLPEDERHLDALLAELDERVGTEPRKTVTVEPIPWDARVIASGCRTAGKLLWRFTLDAGVAEVTVDVGGERRTLAPEAGEVGVWFSHPAGEKLVVVAP